MEKNNRIGLAPTDINNVPLPTAEDTMYPTEIADAINKMDTTKAQIVTAKMIQNGSNYSIVLDDEVLNFADLEKYSNNMAYAFKIEYEKLYYRKAFLQITKNESGSTGKIIFKQTEKSDIGNIDIKTITVNSTDGETISSIIYTICQPENSGNKVTTLSESSTNTEYPSAKTVYEFTNDQINKTANYYITKNAAGDPFATKAELISASKYYCGGVERVPQRNDYCIVKNDESKDDDSSRYTYQNGQWEFQRVYDKNYTEEQLAAINSNVTAAKVSEYDNKIGAMDFSRAIVYEEQTVVEELRGYILQQELNITQKVKKLVKDKSLPYIKGLSGTNYGEPSDTFTGIKYIWFDNTQPLPDAATQALYKNTLFCTKEESDSVGNLVTIRR